MESYAKRTTAKMQRLQVP